MPDAHPRCSTCDQFMERGHIPDVTHGTVLPQSWASGEPRKALLGGIKYDRKELMPIAAYRCPQCGRVDLYSAVATPSVAWPTLRL